jgi:hypothetical protein
MKTTIDIADAILARAKALANRERRTLRQLVEEGLQLVLRSRRQSGRFRLRRASFRGEGLAPDLREGSWDSIRDRAYEGHGA